MTDHVFKIEFLDADDTISEFKSTVERLCVPGRNILCVTHREGISDLLEPIVGTRRIDRNYCCRTEFMYSVDNGEWDVLNHYSPKYTRTGDEVLVDLRDVVHWKRRSCSKCTQELVCESFFFLVNFN